MDGWKWKVVKVRWDNTTRKGEKNVTGENLKKDLSGEKRMK